MTAAPGGVAVVLRRGVDLRSAAADRLTVDLGEILLRVVETTGGEAPPGVTDPLNVAADLADATPLRGVVDLAAVTLLRVVAAVDSAAVTHLRVGAEDTTAATLLRVVAATAAA